MALLDDVKLALRIQHNLLDAEIETVIEAAQAELVRAGVDAAKVASGEDLVQQAIKIYALEYYTRDPKEAERYSQSFKYQCDNLRKTFPAEVVLDV